MLCPYCKEEILDGAIKCKHCKSMLVSMDAERREAKEPISIYSILSLIFGIMVCLLALSDAAGNIWNKDSVSGAIFLSIPSIALGVIGVSKDERKKGLGIAGIFLGGFMVLIALGSLAGR